MRYYKLDQKEEKEALEFDADIEGIMEENDEINTQQHTPRRVTFHYTVDQYKGPGHQELKGLQTSYNDPNTAWFSPPKTKTTTHSTLANTPIESPTGREIDITREHRQDKALLRQDKTTLDSENDEERRINSIIFIFFWT